MSAELEHQKGRLRTSFLPERSYLLDMNFPDAANNFAAAIQLPAFKAVSLEYFKATFVSSAVVANRVPYISIARADGRIIDFPIGSAIAASTTVIITWAKGLGYVQSTAARIMVGLPDLIFIDAQLFGTNGDAAQLGDTVGLSALQFRVWT
jgi:hypothetical protein